MPEITVVLSSYNHDKYISESIESILRQSFEDFELFIVDDHSTDTSWDIICDYAKKDKRITPIRHEYNWGRLGMQTLFNEMKGKYVAVAHCDDRWEIDKLEKQIKILREKDVAACFTHVKLIGDDGEEITRENHHYAGIFEQPNRTRYQWLNYFFYNGNGLCHPSILIRKEAYLNYDLIPKGLHGYPDFCQWIRLCKHENIYVLPEKLTHFRIHADESNASGWNDKNLKRVFFEEKIILEEFVEIADRKEILSVFPEAKKYVNNGVIIDHFALAQLMMSIPKSTYILKGLELIYNLFQDEEMEKRLKQLYGYTTKDYNLDKQKYDIFHMLDAERYMTATVYFQNEENVYWDEGKIVTSIFLKESGEFFFKIDLTSKSKKDLEHIRLDLDEGKYRRFWLYDVTNNGEHVIANPINGIEAGDRSDFFTLDPQYEFHNMQPGELIVRGKTELIPNNEVENYFTQLITKRNETDSPAKPNFLKAIYLKFQDRKERRR